MIPQWTNCSERWARVDTSWLAKINSRSDLATYLALCSRANGQTRDAWPAKATIAKDTGIAPEEVRRSLRELEKIGAIKTNTRFFSGEQTSSQYTIQESVTDGRFAFVAAPWIARIKTLNALRLFVALCSCANHEDSVVRGYSRTDLAEIIGFHASAVPKALRVLIKIGAIVASHSDGGKSAYRIDSPPEAWLADNCQGHQKRRDQVCRFTAVVEYYRLIGTTIQVCAVNGKASVVCNGSSREAAEIEIDPYLATLPLALISAAIENNDIFELAKKAA